jgi:GT2 family glycosyltransferase
MGAAVLFRRATFEELGGFDQRFFLYFEETDLMLHATKKGLKILYEPSIKISHYLGASIQEHEFGQGSPYFMTSAYRFMSKNYGALYSLVLRVLTTLGLAINLIIIRILLKFKNLPTNAKGFLPSGYRFTKRALLWHLREAK